jgi:hypothetical protein
MPEAGHGHQRPYDAFWVARDAIVEDPEVSEPLIIGRLRESCWSEGM